MKWLSILVLVLGTQAHANSLDTIIIPANITVQPSQTRTLELRQVLFVRKLIVQAEGLVRDSTVEVVVNGETVGTIYAPGSDPSYVVTVDQQTSSIQFRYRSGGAMQITQVKALVSTPIWPEPPLQTSVRGLATQVIRIVDSLTPYSSPDDLSQSLLPLKVKAGDVEVMGESHGDLSSSTRQALMDLQNQIQTADPYINTLLSKSGLFELGIQLLVVKETIAELLN